MDDPRLANLLFLAGLASVAIPGCGGDGVGDGEITPVGNPPGNPLATHSGLGEGDASDACNAYISKLIECSGNDSDDYNSGGYYGASVAPGYAGYCDEYLRLFESYGGTACVTAATDYFSCLSVLSCQALGDDSACGGALVAVAQACEPPGSGGGQGEGGE